MNVQTEHLHKDCLRFQHANANNQEAGIGLPARVQLTSTFDVWICFGTWQNLNVYENRASSTQTAY